MIRSVVLAACYSLPACCVVLPAHTGYSPLGLPAYYVIPSILLAMVMTTTIWTHPGWGKTLRARGALGLRMDCLLADLVVLRIYDT